MTLTYNISLAKVKGNIHTKNQGNRSNGLAVRVLTHTDTHTDTHTHSRLRSYDLDRWREHFIVVIWISKTQSPPIFIFISYVRVNIPSFMNPSKTPAHDYRVRGWSLTVSLQDQVIHQISKGTVCYWRCSTGKETWSGYVFKSYFLIKKCLWKIIKCFHPI